MLDRLRIATLAALCALALAVLACGGGSSTPDTTGASTSAAPANDVTVSGRVDQGFEGPFDGEVALTANTRLVQSFRPKQSQLVGIDVFVMVQAAAGTATASTADRVLTVSIEDSKAAVIGTASVTLPLGTTATRDNPRVVHFTFATPIAVTVGSGYGLHLDQDGLVMYRWLRVLGNPYPEGLAYAGDATVSNGDADFGFRTYAPAQ